LEEVQRLINRQAQAVTGAFQSTPIGPLLREAGLDAAEVALDNQQRRYAARLLALPQGHQAQEVLPVTLQERDRHAQPGEQPVNNQEWAQPGAAKTLGQHLAQKLATQLEVDPSGGFERTVETHSEVFPGKIVIQGAEEALRKAQGAGQGLVLWSDGSQLENGRVGAGVAWKPEHASWNTQETPLGKRVEVFDVELHDVCSALEIAERLECDGRATVFLDSQAAIRRLQHTEPGPGQELAMRAQATARRLQAQQMEVTVQWVPGHAGVEGNKQADKAAKQAAAKPAEEGVISLAHVRKRGTEKHSAQRKK
jgi:ribonuclease HI